MKLCAVSPFKSASPRYPRQVRSDATGNLSGQRQSLEGKRLRVADRQGHGQARWGRRERTFPIGSRKVTFVICGEITGFNPDGTMKHRRRLQFDILANPVHTIMRRWYWLGPKLSALSKGRTVVHVANNPGNHGNLRTDLRIYIDGKLQDRRVKHGEPLKWCECVI